MDSLNKLDTPQVGENGAVDSAVKAADEVFCLSCGGIFSLGASHDFPACGVEKGWPEYTLVPLVDIPEGATTPLNSRYPWRLHGRHGLVAMPLKDARRKEFVRPGFSQMIMIEGKFCGDFT